MSRYKRLSWLLLGFGVISICIIAIVFPRHRSGPFISAVIKDEYSLEGELVFHGAEETWHHHVLEYHDDANYGIEYLGRSYFVIDGQYFIDDGKGRVLVSELEEEMHQIEEMFARVSVLSNYNFSNLEYSKSFSTDIPEISSGETISCICEEYIVKDLEKDAEKTVRIYFNNDKLYAIQAREDLRFIFYVTNFSESPQQYF